MKIETESAMIYLGGPDLDQFQKGNVETGLCCSVQPNQSLEHVGGVIYPGYASIGIRYGTRAAGDFIRHDENHTHVIELAGQTNADLT